MCPTTNLWTGKRSLFRVEYIKLNFKVKSNLKKGNAKKKFSLLLEKTIFLLN